MKRKYRRKLGRVVGVLSVCGFLGWIGYSQGAQLGILNKLNESVSVTSLGKQKAVAEAATSLYTIGKSPFGLGAGQKGKENAKLKSTTNVSANVPTKPPINSMPPIKIPAASMPFENVNKQENKITLKAVIYSEEGNNVAIIKDSNKGSGVEGEVTVKEGNATTVGTVESIFKDHIVINRKSYYIEK